MTKEFSIRYITNPNCAHKKAIVATELSAFVPARGTIVEFRTGDNDFLRGQVTSIYMSLHTNFVDVYLEAFIGRFKKPTIGV